MKQLIKYLAVAVFSLSLPALADDDADGYTPENVDYFPVEHVPERVMETARGEKPGLYITSVAKQLWANDNTYYVLYGSQVGKFWVLTVRADGTLMDIDEESEPRRR